MKTKKGLAGNQGNSTKGSLNYNQVRKIVDQLPAEQREVLVLRQYAGLSFKEIAAIMNCSIHTALTRMRMGLINLKNMMAAHQMTT